MKSPKQRVVTVEASGSERVVFLSVGMDGQEHLTRPSGHGLWSACTVVGARTSIGQMPAEGFPARSHHLRPGSRKRGLVDGQVGFGKTAEDDGLHRTACCQHLTNRRDCHR